MLKRVALFLGGLAILFFAAGLFLPDQIRVKREIEIRATPDAVFPYVNNFKKFNEWQPWVRLDKSTKYTFLGPESGKGAKLTWASERMGVGSQEIILSEPNKRVQTRMEFGEEENVTATFTLRPSQAGTTVSWEFHQELGFDIPGRYLGMLIDGWIGKDYEMGLKNLKELVEGGKK